MQLLVKITQIAPHFFVAQPLSQKQKLFNIPVELRILPQWVAYSTEQKLDKYNKPKLAKIMKSPKTKRLALSNDESAWSDFDTAMQYMLEQKMEGLAFVLKSGITFIDLDHVISVDTGEIVNETAKKIISEFPKTYTELSASRTGIHIMCIGSLPKNSRNRNNKSGVDIEMYDKLRFVCFTGNVWENRSKLLDCSEAISNISKVYVGERPKTECKKRPCFNDITLSDTELINRIMRSRQANKFSKLYAGTTSDYVSHSQADSALIWLLAFWTRDYYQIDRIYRASGLYRPKWDRRLYSTTYGDDMINTALASVKKHREMEVY